MINSFEERMFENERSLDFDSVQNQKLRLSLIQELNATLTIHNDSVDGQLELKHTFPMGVGMFES
jgi:hypothetical protein